MTLGGLRKVTVAPRAKLFFPEERPRLMTVLLGEFWSGPAMRRGSSGRSPR